MDRVTEFAIVGAGPCGLGAAWRLQTARPHVEYLLIDEHGEAGGSASSVTTPEGFTFDFGSHVLFPHEHYSSFKRLIDELVPAWYASAPVRGVWMDRRLIPYPVQQNIHRLPAHKMLASLAGLCAVSLRRSLADGETTCGPVNLERHLIAKFGGGLTRLVLGPLNRKMWAYDLAELDSGWTGQRSGSNVPNVAEASLWPILWSIATGRDRPGWSETTRVRYPLRGGTGAIWTSLASRLPRNRLIHGQRVVAVDAQARRLVLSSGERIRYERLVSTMPLDVLLASLTGSPAVARSGAAFRFSRAGFVGFGLRGVPPRRLAGVHSFHVPQADVPCWRVGFPAAFSPENAPSEHWSILCEISAPPDEPLDLDALARVIESKLRDEEIVPKDAEIVSRWQHQLRHGYPTPFIGRDALLRHIDLELRASAIVSRGRFGGWKYEVSNQDHTFMQGVEAVDMLLGEQPEVTYRLSALVNELAS